MLLTTKIIYLFMFGGLRDVRHIKIYFIQNHQNNLFILYWNNNKNKNYDDNNNNKQTHNQYNDEGTPFYEIHLGSNLLQTTQ